VVREVLREDKCWGNLDDLVPERNLGKKFWHTSNLHWVAGLKCDIHADIMQIFCDREARDII